jgi:hypothetical protein
MKKKIEIVPLIMTALVLVGVFAITAPLALSTGACTPTQRAVVRSVVDLVDEVCGDQDSLDDCLTKAQAKRSAMRAGAAADAGAAGAD